MVQIELLRISRDSKFIEIIAECYGDVFKELSIKRYGEVNWNDASSLVLNKNRVSLRIETAMLGGPGMFEVQFGLGDSNESCGVDPQKRTVAYVSDINNVYTYILTLLLDLDCKCLEPSTELYKMFAFLYGHQEALRLGRIDEAYDFYKVIQKNLKLCGYSAKATSVGCAPTNCGCNG